MLQSHLVTLQILLWSITRQGDEVTDNQRGEKKKTNTKNLLLVLKGILNFDNSPTGVSAIWPTGTRENNLNPSQHSKLPLCYKSLAHALGTEREQLRQDRLERSEGSSVTQCWKKTLQYYMLPNTYTSQSLTYLPAKPVSRATKQEKLLQSYCQVLEWLATANFPVHNHSMFSFAMEMLFFFLIYFVAMDYYYFF